MSEKPKCVYFKCYHDENEHRDGLCWHITQPEEEGDNQYCPCTFGDSNHRLFEAKGLMDAEESDSMITKHCGKCNKARLLRVDEPYCHNCKHSI